jgi:hypothetical protein
MKCSELPDNPNWESITIESFHSDFKSKLRDLQNQPLTNQSPCVDQKLEGRMLFLKFGVVGLFSL